MNMPTAPVSGGSVRSVPAYALVVGAPARQIGWMSRRGCRLEFDGEGRAACSESGEVYTLQNNEVQIIEYPYDNGGGR